MHNCNFWYFSILSSLWNNTYCPQKELGSLVLQFSVPLIRQTHTDTNFQNIGVDYSENVVSDKVHRSPIKQYVRVQIPVQIKRFKKESNPISQYYIKTAKICHMVNIIKRLKFYILMYQSLSKKI